MDEAVLGVLREIRDEAKQTNARLDQTNARLDQTNARLGQTNARLDVMGDRIDVMGDRLERVEKRQVASELRLATELVAVTSAIHELKGVLLVDRELRRDILDHERRIQTLEQGQRGGR
jgi:septal ring factor EnvC (AmiA/AmiB activator)